MSTPAKWVLIWFEDAKLHAVCRALAPALIADMVSRGSKHTRTEPLQIFGMDRGGMAYLKRPVVRLVVGSLRVNFPSEHVGHFLASLKTLPPRRFGKRTYYKLHSHYNCLVLTPKQRALLIAAMEAAYPLAEAEAHAFYRNAKPLNVALAEANVYATGSPGPEHSDPHARFHREVGKA